MAAHLPRLPFILLFVFLAVHAPASSHGDPAPPLTTYDASMCLESSMCGNISIRYPFYLSSTTRIITDYNYNTTSYSCGYTDLEISCQGEGPKATPAIILRGHHYTVLDIFYDSKSIILADSDVLHGGSCPVVLHDLSFDKLWLQNTSSNENLTFYFGCYTSRGPGVTVPLDLFAYKIDCDLKGPFGEGAYSFIFTPDDHWKAQEHELDQYGRCSEVVSVPVRSEVLMANNQSMLVRGGYAEVLWYGFELEWYQGTTDQCHLCEQSDGKCAYSQNQKREFLGCLCFNSKVGHPDCRSSKSSKTDHSI